MNADAATNNTSSNSSNLTLEYHYIYDHSTYAVLHMQNQSLVDWVPNQTNVPPCDLYTNAWIFEPYTNKTGYRFSLLRVTYHEDCLYALNYSLYHTSYPIKFLMYPFSYATVSPEFGSDFQNLPIFCDEVTVRSFNNSGTYVKNFSSGELFIGFRATVKFSRNAAGEYVIRQTNVTSCTITVEAFGPTVMVDSLTLFYGILALILLPAILTIIVHFIMLVSQRNASEKSEAGFKRVTCECRLFWVSWIACFAAFIGIILVPMY